MQHGLILRGFIASPSDVRVERDAAAEVMMHWNGVHSFARAICIQPVTLEHAGLASDAHPQEIINRELLERCDFLIAIFWSRIGTPTDQQASGTIDEIKEFARLHGSRHVKLFFSDQSYPAGHDRDQLAQLDAFKEEMQTASLYSSFGSIMVWTNWARQ